MEHLYETNSSLHTHIVMMKAWRTIESNLGKIVKSNGLTMTQFGVLDVLYAKGSLRICELIQSMLATSGNMTVVLKNMEKQGLIYKEASETDKRATIIGMTEKGKQLFQEILPQHHQEIEEVYRLLSKEQKALLISLLKTFKQVHTEEKQCQENQF
ncbi:MarR family transcriptional regulator [Carnobacteriaceae bacterium zg-ZUI78]|nr:MarR family transcriptional regulator [Carnobacteriaceae bacterium zg-ZUI78]